jgi:ABC-type antimicrobial peptide transport system permease subunit
MAIGATPWDVVRIVFRQGMWPVVIGLIVGMGLALMGTQVIGSYLVGGVSARDPIAFGLAAGVLLIFAAVGVLIPARRATRVDPVAALREP